MAIPKMTRPMKKIEVHARTTSARMPSNIAEVTSGVQVNSARAIPGKISPAPRSDRISFFFISLFHGHIGFRVILYPAAATH